MKLPLFWKAFLWCYAPPALALLFVVAGKLGWVPDFVLASAGPCLSIPLVILFAIPAYLGGAGFFEFGIGVGPAGAAGLAYSAVFWALVAAALAGLVATFAPRPPERHRRSDA